MKRVLGIFMVAVFGGLAALGLNHFFFSNKSNPQSFEEKQQVQFAKQLVAPDGQLVDFTQVSEHATPTVVHIKTTMQQASAQGQDQELFDPFGFFNDPRFRQNAPREASGSGVIITNDGYIATNNHVIENASKIEVILNDKRSYPAELIGRDPETDLALLKIEEKNLDFLSFGNSDDLKVGEWVIAVGNPFNLTSTVTAGIVSAKGRNINLLRQNSEYAIENFIQTDAAVNPGNSGGALVNTRGELIGINTAIASQTGSYAGYSFAVPVNIAKKVLDDLLKYGEVKRAILGVRIQDISAELADEKGLKEIKGVFVPEVIEDGAAEKAGLKDEDVILSINSVEVNKASELQEQISKYHPGDKISIKIKRKGEVMTKDVTLLSRDGKKEIVNETRREEQTALGGTFENISRDEKLDLKLRNGVRLKKVTKGPLKDKNIPEGFVITNIDKQRVYTTQDVVKLLENKKGSVLIDGVKKDGSEESYAIRIE
ncbi:MAG: Do family serine endopeptidase [Flavobacteriales bacterium]|nr:Do family serine endopeptidase [Bacteroidota bacterium]MCB9240539.1 Do family serine endopeptidase [Flavobacteriales bacterium]